MSIGDVDAAVPFAIREVEKAVNYMVGDSDVAVFFKLGTRSVLDRSGIDRSKDVGVTGVFDPNVEGWKLTFRADGDTIVDKETGSAWDILGRAVSGTLEGSQLTPIVHANHFWFAWGAFKPDTKIYQGRKNQARA